MFRCQTIVDAATIAEAWMTRQQVNREIGHLLADGWKRLVCEPNWLSFWFVEGEHLAIVRFVR